MISTDLVLANADYPVNPIFELSRREFLKTSAIFASAVAIGSADAPSPPLPCLVVGEGSFAQILTDEIRSAGGECVGFVRHSRTRNDVMDKTKKYYRSIFEGVKETFARVVVIATPDNTHVELVLESLKAGAHALLAAPSGCTFLEWQGVVRAAKETRRQVQLTAEGRLLPEFTELSRRLRAGEFGRIESVRLSVSSELPSRGWHRNGQKSYGLLGRYGESMVDHLAQCGDFTAPFRVRSFGDRVSYRGPGSVPVHQFVSWECDSFRADWEGQISATGATPVAEIVYVCSKGTVVLDWAAGWSVIYNDGQSEPIHRISTGCTQKRVARLAYKDLCDAIHGRRECLASLANIGWAVSAIDMGMEAFYTGKKMAVAKSVN